MDMREALAAEEVLVAVVVFLEVVDFHIFHYTMDTLDQANAEVVGARSVLLVCITVKVT